jgi:hypothetical protein
MFIALAPNIQKEVEAEMYRHLRGFIMNGNAENPGWLYSTRDTIVSLFDSADIFHGSQAVLRQMVDFENVGGRGLFNEAYAVWKRMYQTINPGKEDPREIQEVISYLAG